MKYTDQHIHQYLSWKMSPAERQQFESELTANHELATRVVIHKHMRDDIRKSHMSEILKQEFFPEVEQRPLRPYLLLAAGLAILISIGFWLYPLQVNEVHPLYTEYGQLPPRIESPVMGPTSTESFLNHSQYAMVAYEEGKFESALSEFKNLQSIFLQNDSLQFYIGNTFLAMHHADSAMLYYEKVLEQSESIFWQDAQWFKLMALLQAGEENKAKLYLKELDISENHKYERSLHEIQSALEEKNNE